ncbi:hypothetical protein EYC80_003469 [Monilinia laxa]|uniref:Uncharacterized protein n=1 Tax=Monilinia laxa TaxID=61186 RepID=A0A5N6KE01_MONLA|nr:hypothetical protein EYC80_003469 [Monilinia laxa]
MRVIQGCVCNDGHSQPLRLKGLEDVNHVMEILWLAWMMGVEMRSAEDDLGDWGKDRFPAAMGTGRYWGKARLGWMWRDLIRHVGKPTLRILGKGPN